MRNFLGHLVSFTLAYLLYVKCCKSFLVVFVCLFVCILLVSFLCVCVFYSWIVLNLNFARSENGQNIGYVLRTDAHVNDIFRLPANDMTAICGSRT